MITTARMKALEKRSEQLGVSRAQLMETAGLETARSIHERYGNGLRILVLAYHGNNGGDGFVAARHLAKDNSVNVWFLGSRERLALEAQKNFEQLDPSLFVEYPHFDEYDILIDALLGTGTKGNLKEPIRSVLSLWNRAHATKVALDVPTGIDPDNEGRDEFFEADLIIAFHDLKPGLLPFIDRTVIADIGIPEEACEH